MIPRAVVLDLGTIMGAIGSLGVLGFLVKFIAERRANRHQAVILPLTAEAQDIANEATQVEIAQRVNVMVRGDLTEVRAELSRARGELDAAYRVLSTAREDLAISHRELSEAQGHVAELRAQVSDLRDRMTITEAALRESRELLRKAEDRIAELESGRRPNAT